MGQEQNRTGGSDKRTEKEKPEEADRAKVAGFDEKLDNNPAMNWSGKAKPLSKPC